MHFKRFAKKAKEKKKMNISYSIKPLSENMKVGLDITVGCFPSKAIMELLVMDMSQEINSQPAKLYSTSAHLVRDTKLSHLHGCQERCAKKWNYSSNDDTRLRNTQSMTMATG